MASKLSTFQVAKQNLEMGGPGFTSTEPDWIRSALLIRETYEQMRMESSRRERRVGVEKYILLFRSGELAERMRREQMSRQIGIKEARWVIPDTSEFGIFLKERSSEWTTHVH